MCPPRFFGVQYVINPWMEGNVGKPTPEASHQWERLVAHIRAAGATEIATIDPVPDLPDLVFTANAAVIHGRRAILSRFRHRERAPEAAIYGAWFEQHGYTVEQLDGFFEGAGDALFDRQEPLIYGGYGHRSDLRAIEELGERLAVPVLPLELSNPAFYHLDVALCPLGTGHVMAHLAAFAAPAQAMLRERLGERLIAVDEIDARSFACNTVEIEGTLIMHAASPQLRERLTMLGYRVVETPLSAFLRAGGSAKCLTLKLDDAAYLYEPGDSDTLSGDVHV